MNKGSHIKRILFRARIGVGRGVSMRVDFVPGKGLTLKEICFGGLGCSCGCADSALVRTLRH